MRLAAAVLLLALVLALPGARASGYDFTSGRSFAQPAADGGLNVFTVPFHVNGPGFVYVKMLDTDRNVVNDGAKANGSASAKTGWWIEWALVQGGQTKELGARDDDKPTELVAVAAGEDDAILLRVHWPSAANAPATADTVYAALAFRNEAVGGAPGGSSGASMDEARSFHVEIEFTGGVLVGGSGSSAAPATSPDAGSAPITGGGATGGGASGTSGGGSSAAQTPTPDVAPIGAGSGSGAARVTVVNQEAPLPSWLVPVLVAQGFLVLAACVVVIVASRRRQRIELVVTSGVSGPIVVETPGSPESARSIVVKEK